MRVLILILVAGCSFAMTRPPHAHAPGQPPDCNTSDMVPSLDALAGLADIVGGVYYAHENGFEHGALGLVVGGIYAAAAVYGERNVRACRRETDVAVAALVADAAMAMRSGGCGPVLDTAVRLAQDAPDAYVTFIHDPTFAACF